jgi:hypothetical protein
MPLLEVTTVKKITAIVVLEESTTKLVDQYAAFLKASADDVVNHALLYVFGKDKEFQQFRERNAVVPAALRVKKPAPITSGKRGRKAALVAAN